ncbi:MAG TPA: biopolymer transporter ExbD [Thermoanaerobaculia bacterium]|jgi:biopolymer transport protein ExbD
MLQSDINVTPLVDVCLVLLIIFMVVLPSMVNTGTIELPEVQSGESLEEKPLPVTVKADGTVYLDTLVIRRDEVTSALQRLHAQSPSRAVAVRADKRALYGEVASVLAACRTAGWSDVTLVGTRARQ